MAKLIYYVGSHKVESIEMLDNVTCLLIFVDEEDKENNTHVSIQVEYWLDEQTWHFNDLWYDADGMYIESVETEHLTPEQKEKCKEIMNTWMANNIK